MATLYDENSPLQQISDPDSERTLGLSGLDVFPNQPSGYPNATFGGGGILYPEDKLTAAHNLANAPMHAFYDDPAPYKVAEEWQIADISYAVEYANQDYRRMNEAQSLSNTWRTKAPKWTDRPTTSEIIGNLNSSPANALQSDDASILALFGM